MMKAYALVFLLMLGLFSCSKDQEAKQQIPASIQTLITSYGETGCVCMPVINQYSWKGQIVYVLSYRGPACNWVPSFYDAEGKVIATIDRANYNSFLAQSHLVRKVWSCE